MPTRSPSFLRALVSGIGVTAMLAGATLLAAPAAAAPPPLDVAPWTVLAAGERASVLTPTTGNVTTAHNGSEWYYRGDASIGFAPAGAPVTLNTADTAASSWTNSVDATTPYRLSWHTSGDSITGGWRAGANINLYSGWQRAVYEADTLPSYYPTGPQIDVDRADLTGWTMCYSGGYDDTTALATVFAACDGAYLLYAGGPAAGLGIDVSVAGDSVLNQPSGYQVDSIAAGVELELEAIDSDGVTPLAWNHFIVYVSECSGPGCASDPPMIDPAQWDAGTATDSTYTVPAEAAGRQLLVYAADDATGEPVNEGEVLLFAAPAQPEQPYLFSWGNGDYGTLGTGDDFSSLSPVPVQAPAGFDHATITQLALGDDHACAVADGSVWCWGDNESGQVGNQDSFDAAEESYVPVLVDATDGFSNTDVTHVSAGEDHTCAIEGGEVWCWGDNNSGALGDEDSYSDGYSSVPVKVDAANGFANSGVTAIALGDDFTCAIESGEVFCWGYYEEGRLGNADAYSAADDALVPVPVDDASGFENEAVTQIALGDSHACAIEGGVLYCWGAGDDGQLGSGSSDDALSPVLVLDGDGFENAAVDSVDVGGGFTCALQDGELYCFGYNGSGQLGDVANFDDSGWSDEPLRVDPNGGFTNADVTQFTLGYEHACAVEGGSLYCWGENEDGQLGNAENFDADGYSPLALLVDDGDGFDNEGIELVAAGRYASIALGDVPDAAPGLPATGASSGLPAASGLALALLIGGAVVLVSRRALVGVGARG